MAQSLEYRAKAARCRRLARDCTDQDTRQTLLKLSDEYSAHAAALENAESRAQHPGADDT
jgi:hypothetical protein